jgi:hypothetical protein
MPTRDELLQIVNTKSAEAAIQQIAREAEANASNYYELAAAGRFDDAAQHLREAWRLDEEARKIAASVQPQRPQSQYTPKWSKSYCAIIRRSRVTPRNGKRRW